MVYGHGAALSVNVNPAVLTTETLHLESPQEMVANDAPGRMDVGQWLELVSFIVWRWRDRWLFGTLQQLSGELGGEMRRLDYNIMAQRLFHTGKNLVPGVGQGEGGVVLTSYSTTHQVAGAKV
jgi:hypothetical protein